MDLGSLQPELWAEQNFGSACLGERRRTRRLVACAARAAQRPGGSLPQMMQDPAALDGLYRLVDRPEVTHAAVLQPHGERTRQRMRTSDDVVLIVKDFTELDFTT